MNRSIDMDKYSRNEIEIMREFKEYPQSIRTDHYDGKHSLSRLAATVTELFGKPIFTEDQIQTEKNIEIVKNILESQEIKPYSIFIFDPIIYVNWVSNGDQIVRSIEEYMELSLEFARYIDNIKCLSIEVQIGMYSDDPDKIEPSVQFSEECFDRTFGDRSYMEEMDVIYM